MPAIIVGTNLAAVTTAVRSPGRRGRVADHARPSPPKPGEWQSRQVEEEAALSSGVCEILMVILFGGIVEGRE